MSGQTSLETQAFWRRFLRPERALALGFLSLIMAGGILLSLPIAAVGRRSIGLLNAFFTATSAVCVTGLVVVDTGNAFSVFGKVVLMLLIQMGGLGFMAFATLTMVLLGRRISLRNRVLIRESMNTTDLSGLVRLTLRFAAIAMLIELAGACVLATRFIPIFGARDGLWYSLFHAVSAFCNAGFDIFGGFDSAIPFRQDGVVLLTLAALLILGGLGFPVISELTRMRKNTKRMSLHAKLVLTATASLLVFGTVIILVLEWDNPGTLGGGDLNDGEKILNAFFQSATLRTAGFASMDQAQLTDSSKLLGVILMFIGASSASTGGGVKTTTMTVVLLMVISVVRGQENVNLFGKQIAPGILRRALAVVIISLGLVIVSTCVLSVLERDAGIPLIDLAYEAASAFGTVGVSSVGTPTLGKASHILLMPIMFFGRVGPLTMAFALASRMESNPKNRMHYPEERVMIG